jgi:hypothetical protein
MRLSKDLRRLVNVSAESVDPNGKQWLTALNLYHLGLAGKCATNCKV